jgi:hypothetical protein
VEVDVRDRWLACGLLLIAFGLATVALLGPLATGAVDYRVTETLRNQTIGLDAASLLVVAPLATAAALLVRRGHVADKALALGIGAYTSYMVLQYAVGPQYESCPATTSGSFRSAPCSSPVAGSSRWRLGALSTPPASRCSRDALICSAADCCRSSPPWPSPVTCQAWRIG